MNCTWCHNPEAKKEEIELSYEPALCIGCGKCVGLCRQECHSFREGVHIYNRQNCIGCGECANVCCGALSIVGRKVTVDEVLQEVLRDKIFFDSSSGGMTVSGGEPFFQYPFLLELIKRAKEEGITTCVETNGCTDSSNIVEASHFIDVFLVDYKISNDELGLKTIGPTYATVMTNLEVLNDIGKTVVLRCPIIPTINDTTFHFSQIAKIAERYKNIDHIEIEPYHPLGVHKAVLIGETCKYINTIPDKEQVALWLKSIQVNTAKEVLIA